MYCPREGVFSMLLKSSLRHHVNTIKCTHCKGQFRVGQMYALLAEDTDPPCPFIPLGSVASNLHTDQNVGHFRQDRARAGWYGHGQDT